MSAHGRLYNMRRKESHGFMVSEQVAIECVECSNAIPLMLSVVVSITYIGQVALGSLLELHSGWGGGVFRSCG